MADQCWTCRHSIEACTCPMGVPDPLDDADKTMEADDDAVHDLPLVFSDADPMHELTTTCWCDPVIEHVGRVKHVVHIDTQRGDS